MNTHSSGYYSIDKDYNILSYNDTARQLYPHLQPGDAIRHLWGLIPHVRPALWHWGYRGQRLTWIRSVIFMRQLMQ